MRRCVVVAVLAVVALVGSSVPAAAATDPVDSLATARVRITTKLVGLSEDLDGGRVDLSANGQFVLFDRPGTGVGLFDSVRNQTVVLGDVTARPFSVSDDGSVVLYASGGAPLRWNRANGQSEALPWSGGLITDMALDQSGDVIAYTERTGVGSAILRTWVAPVDDDASARVRSFGASIVENPVVSRDRDVFVTNNGQTALFRSGSSSIRGLDIASGTASVIPLTDLIGLDRAGVLQVEEGSGGPVRFEIGGSTTTERTAVEFPAPVNGHTSVAIAGDGSSVAFHSRSELYRWKTTGELVFLQPTNNETIGDIRDASITGRFLLTARPGASDGILELVEVGRSEIPIIATETLQGPQLSDQIRRLYLAYFDREPDASGGQSWRVALAKGTELDQISQSFAGSTEFINTYGSLDDPAFVDLVYNNVLGRDGEPEGRTFWIAQLAAGMSRGTVMTGFSEGTEFRNRTGTSTPSTSTVAPKIERLYRAYFDRPADQGGLDFWLEQFVAGADLGTLSQEFVGSTEFQNTYGSLDDAQFVDLVYNNVLGRDGEPEGRAFWINQLATQTLNRGQVMIGFSESAEFIVATDTVP